MLSCKKNGPTHTASYFNFDGMKPITWRYNAGGRTDLLIWLGRVGISMDGVLFVTSFFVFDSARLRDSPATANGELVELYMT